MKRLVKKEIGDERLGRKDVMIKVVGYVGKDKETVRLLPIFVWPSLHAMHSYCILLRGNWEEV